VYRLAEWIVEKTSPRDPVRRERYFQAWAVIGVGCCVWVVGRYVLHWW
jgi:hypothetical protein